MKLTLRQKILGIALAMTLALSLYSQFDESAKQEIDIVEPLRKRVLEKPLVQTVKSNSFPKVLRTPWHISESEINLFPAVIEKKPEDNLKINLPFEEQVPSLPPVPAAPPLPFTYLGKMIDGAAITVFVSKNGRNLTLKGGELIEGIYVVKSIDPQKVVFEYIPLNLEQILLIRG